jgi:hypothetical protein
MGLAWIIGAPIGALFAVSPARRAGVPLAAELVLDSGSRVSVTLMMTVS